MPMFNGQQMPQMPWQNAALGGGAMSPQFAPQLPWQRMGQQGGNPMPWTQAQPMGAQGQGGMYNPQGGFGGGDRFSMFKQRQGGNLQPGGAARPADDEIKVNAWRKAGAAGSYDPFGSPQLLEMLRQSGLSDMGARLNSNRLNVQLHGNDPYLQAYGSLMGNMGGQSDVFRSLQEAQLQQGLQSQDWWHQIFSQALGISSDQEAAKYTRDAAAKARKQSGRNAAIGAVGQLGGAALGAIGGKK